MKAINNIQAYLLGALIFVAGVTQARAFENVEVSIEDNSNVVQLKISNPSIGNLDLMLLNSRDQVIREDRMGDLSSLEQSYNFDGLKEGTYTLVSSLRHMHYTKVLEVRDSKVTMTDSYYSFSPTFKMEDDKILVHYVMEGDRDVSVSIEQNSDTIFDSFFDNNEKVFSKAFAIDGLSSGSYTMRVVSQDDFYSYEFQVD
jgi:hypothetical protein